MGAQGIRAPSHCLGFRVVAIYVTKPSARQTSRVVCSGFRGLGDQNLRTGTWKAC